MFIVLIQLCNISFMNVYQVDMENNDNVVLMMTTMIKSCFRLCRIYVHCSVGGKYRRGSLQSSCLAALAKTC